jgi:hypothetical protein
MSPERELRCGDENDRPRSGGRRCLRRGGFLIERETEAVAKVLKARLGGEAGHKGPGYHLHLEDGEGSELTIAVLDPG